MYARGRARYLRNASGFRAPRDGTLTRRPRLAAGIAAVVALGASIFGSAPAIARGPLGARDADYQTAVTQAHKRYVEDQSGKVTSSIPALASVSPALYGVVVVRVDGKVFEAGDTGTPLVLTGVAAPFTAALVGEQRGADFMNSTAGAVAGTAPVPPGRTPADWGNAPTTALRMEGAMGTLSLVQPQGDAAGKWRALLANLGSFSGGELVLDEKVYQSALSSAEQVNRKSRELSQEGRLVDTPESTADLYLRQGSVAVSTRELAIMAATLANNGVNPVNRKRVVSEPVAMNIQTLLINAGLPGGKKAAWLKKAGVGVSTGESGAIIMVVPGRLGIAVYSPPLDSAGNSVRAQRALRYLVQTLFIGPDPTAP
jgi:glutaminase